MGSVKILTVNCQGLGDPGKRRDVLNFLKVKNYNLYCLQDTHFVTENESFIRSVWGYECFFSSLTSNSRGVAILVNNNVEFKIWKEKKDRNGNFLALDISINGTRLTLLSLYGPNQDIPGFFDNIMSIIEDFGNENYVICGDFNLVLNPTIDCFNYLHINNPNARMKVLEIIDQWNLVDPFREIYPNMRRYTWRKRTPLKQSRLDFFLIPDSMLIHLKTCKIEPSYRSDHSMVTLELEFNPYVRGKGL